MGIVGDLAWILVLLACAATVLGAFARISWLGDLASHFRLQYAGLLLAGALVLLLAKRLPEAALAAGVALINLAPLARLYKKLPSSTHRVVVGRMLVANVLWNNRSRARLPQAIRDIDPDLVAVIESTAEWMPTFHALAPAYPFSLEAMSSRRFGILLLSRIPFERAEVLQLGHAGFPSLLAQFRFDGQPVTLIATHPYSPVTPRRARLRNQQLEALAHFVKGQPGPVIVVGDLNTTSWAPAFQDLLRVANLRDSRQGFGVQPTWPVHLPWLRIPLDHCLVSEEIVITQRRLGPLIGSDHIPILVEFSLATAPQR